MKKALRWIFGLLISPIVIFTMLMVAFYIPPVQQWVVEKVADYASRQTGWQVHIRAVRISFPLDLDLQDMTVHKDSLLDVGVESSVVDLNFSHILDKRLGVDGITLKGGDLDLQIPEREEEDTTKSKSIPLLIGLRRIQLQDCHVLVHMPGDSIRIEGSVQEALLDNGSVDLNKMIYQADNFRLQADSLRYDRWALHNIQASAKNVFYNQDGFYLHAESLDLQTLYSSLKGDLSLDWNDATPLIHGRMESHLQASLGRQDVLDLVGMYLPTEIKEIYPQDAIQANVIARGNVDSLNITECHIQLPEMADIQVTGTACNLTEMEQLESRLHWDVQTMDLSYLRHLLNVSGLRIPGMTLTADTHSQGKKIAAEATLSEGRGQAHLLGQVDLGTIVYQGQLSVDRMNVHDFLPRDSIYSVSGSMKMSGQGTDIYAQNTRMEARAQINSIRYGSLLLRRLTADARLRDGHGWLDVESDNDMLALSACAEATLNRHLSDASFSVDLNHIDLHALHLAKDTLAASMVMHLDGSSNLRNRHQFEGQIQAMELITKDSCYHPVDLQLKALLNPDTVYAWAEAGDMELEINSPQGLDSLIQHVQDFSGELTRQVEQYVMNQDTLKTLLPTMEMHLHSGQHNPVCKVLRMLSGYTYDELRFDLNASPETGLNGGGHMYALNTGSILLDTLQCTIYQDSTGVIMDGRVRNGPHNEVAAFETLMHAYMTPTGATGNLVFNDAKGKKGVDLGMQIQRLEEGIRVHFTPLNPIIAYRGFTLNEDNYIELTRDGRVEALIDLLADDGTGLKVYSTPNEEALQDISISLNNLNVGELASVMPYLPQVTGTLHGDLHYVQNDSTLSVSGDLLVKNMTYEDCPLGDVGLNAVYLPNQDGTHFLDGIISQNGNDVMAVSGLYSPAKEEDEEGWINATAQLTHLPLSMVNGFIPDAMAALQGYAWGDLEISGTPSRPVLEGQLTTDSMYLKSDMYSINLRFPDDTIRVEDSKFNLDKIRAYSASSNPLTLNGTVDCSQLDNIRLNISAQARNYQLINAPKSKQALAYGRVYVDLDARMQGSLDDLQMGGRVNVLGNTNVTYVLRDSPLTVEDRLSDLVTFVDFSDTTQIEPVEDIQGQNVDMRMTISIEQAAQVHCLLSEDGSDYVKLEGGGDLTMTYDTQHDIRLYGRYTIISGQMNYTLMSVVCKNFDIENGSYVEFTGDYMNPTLHITANQRTHASYNENNTPRTVTFNVGLTVSQTLSNMGLQFTIDAPEDMTVQNELASMSDEDRGRIAVTMLATNMYITDLSNTRGLSTANALTSFLQSEINNLVGMAQSTVDVNFGIENNTSATGSNQTNYSFRFAKRFWGNRISLIIGGRISTGQDAVNTGQTLIDNVSLEYRLDQSATRYVKVYYDRNYESLLEGELTEMGAGVVFRRKTNKLADLFRFRTHKKEVQP